MKDKPEKAAPAKTNEKVKEGSDVKPTKDEDALSDEALGRVSGGLADAIHRAHKSPLS